MPSRMIATIVSLVAFAAAVVAGAAAGNRGITILSTGLVVLIGAWLLGSMLGAVAQLAVDEHLKDFARKHPLPELDADQPVVDSSALKELGDPAATSAA